MSFRPVTPVEDETLTGRCYAMLDRDRAVELARLMPDAQSSVLLCLGWQAALQERLRRGPYAGQQVARLSASQLAEMTGRHLRTVRYALSRLKDTGIIEALRSGPGRTAIYRVNGTKAPLPANEPDGSPLV